MVLCRMWPLTSGELHELFELYVSQLKTCLSSTHPSSCASWSSEGSCLTNTVLLFGRLGFGEIKSTNGVHWSWDSYFLLLNGVWQRCCTWFAGSIDAGMEQWVLCMSCNSTLYSLFLILSVHVQADSWGWLGAQQVRLLLMLGACACRSGRGYMCFF